MPVNENIVLSLEDFEAARLFWKELLSGEFPVSRFPSDFLDEGDLELNEFNFAFPDSLSLRLDTVTKERELLLFVFLLAGIQIVLSRYSSSNDLLIGSPVLTGEDQSYDYNLLIPLLFRVSSQSTFKELLKHTRQVALDSYSHQHYPINNILRQLGREGEYQRLFRTVVALDGIHKAPHMNDYKDLAGVDLVFSFSQENKKKHGRVTFNSARLSPSSIERVVRHVLGVLEQAAARLDIPISQIELCSDWEKKRILEEFNHAGSDIPMEATLHQCFLKQSAEGAGRVAVVLGQCQVTYGYLETSSSQICSYLIHEARVMPGHVVGILMDRTLELPAALLGVARAGGVFVPIDPSLPESFIRRIINDTNLKTVISQKNHIRLLDRLQWTCPSLQSYLCADSRDVWSENENAGGGLMDRKLWEYIGTEAVDDIAGGGWISSFTGEHFSPEEMAEFGDNALSKLQAVVNDEMRVLEIGCATGYTMYRLAPLVKEYIGADLSSVIIKKNRERIEGEGIDNIRVEVFSAEEIDKLHEKNFGIVIINSVIQGFPGLHYFLKIVRKAVDMLDDNGYLFIGDVMDLDLKEQFIRDLKVYKNSVKLDDQTVKTDFSDELFVSREFFKDLPYLLPGIAAVDCSDKIGTIKNELTDYRYDVLIKIDKSLPAHRDGSCVRRKFQYDQRALSRFANENHDVLVTPQDPVSVIYTSGSTGSPRGVLIKHGSLVNFSWWRIRTFAMTPEDTALQLMSAAFDAFGGNIYPLLLSGGKTVFVEEKDLSDYDAIGQIIERQQVTCFSVLPSMYRLILDGCGNNDSALRRLRFVILGGETADIATIQLSRSIAQHVQLVNEYGPTENCIATTANSPLDVKNRRVIGKPVANHQVLILDLEFKLSSPGIPGQLCVSGAGMASGYLNCPEHTDRVFVKNILSQGDRLYCTGDRARWLHDGTIEYLGRMDQQLKLRGFRIEPAEIEHRLLSYPNVTGAVVVCHKDKSGDRLLCGYVEMPGRPEGRIHDGDEIKDFLGKGLPHYMVPSHMVILNKFPLTPSGKVDRRSLPLPDTLSHAPYSPPRNETEQLLSRLWGQVLGIDVDGLGIDDDFFRLGGHSLKVTILISHIHREAGVKIPLSEVFRTPTIRGLSTFIAQREAQGFEDIVPAPPSDYYPQSSAQKRLFFLDQFENIGTSYNMPSVYRIRGNIQKQRFEQIFHSLLGRHESLRTSFHLINGDQMQRVHDVVILEIEEFSVPEGDEQERAIQRLASTFSRPFDLSVPPLFRVGLAAMSEHEHIVFFDMHHIIGDGTSMEILLDEFGKIYSNLALPPLDVQYKDFSVWQTRLFSDGGIDSQKDYWLREFDGMIPVLQLPADFRRPKIQSFEGDRIGFDISEVQTRMLREIAQQNNTTMFMLLLALYYILLHKLSGQEDIVIGVPIAGRKHAAVQSVVGMFVNTLAIRSFPEARKTFCGFLSEVRHKSLNGFENQDLQFEDLVEAVGVDRDTSRNPLFDAKFVLQNQQRTEVEIQGLQLLPFKRQNLTSKFDLSLDAVETEDRLHCIMEFSTRIFKSVTIQRFILYFREIVNGVIENPDTEVAEISVITHGEKRRILEEFNDTGHELPERPVFLQRFQQIVQDESELPAIYHEDTTVSYGELGSASNRIANYLALECGMSPGEPVGILFDRSISMMEAIFGVLAAGAAYLPLAPDLPEFRLKQMCRDAGLRVILSSKNHVRLLNRLQWECPQLRIVSYVDSYGFESEEEAEGSGLMDKKLWEYVGETAEDDIAGGGWVSSYTGLPFSRLEMDEYVDNVVEKLTPYLQRDWKVLEIGCASGLTMFHIAPEVGLYVGTDLSQVIIDKNRERVKAEGMENIRLECLPAHEIERLDERDFDLVIINSVVHCFDGHNYLRNVLAKAAGLLKSTGLMFIGDVMDHDLKDKLIEDMVSYADDSVRPEADNYIKTKTDWSAELFVSRDFFRDLAFDISGIFNIIFSSKIHTIANELTRYRYDVILELDKKKDDSPPWKRTKFQHDLRHIGRFEASPPAPAVQPGGLAYIIYTSGSTGIPKGVVIEHRALFNRLHWMQRRYPLSRRDVILQKTTISFDVSVWELFWWSMVGASLVLLPPGDEKDPQSIIKTIRRFQVTTIHFVPSMLSIFLYEVKDRNASQKLTSLRRVFSSGEALPIDQSAIFHRLLTQTNKTLLVNLYGPTEAAVDVSYYDCDAECDAPSIPIGRPIDNIRLYVVDSHLRLNPIGVPGELLIGGVGLARGYLNRPALTARSFIPLPYLPQERVYRTGDLVRWRADGNIEFLGRIDQQVKIRGFRIELGEIEAVLRAHDSIIDAVVEALLDGGDERFLCAYLVSSQDKKPGEKDIQSHLAHRLPHYMVPVCYVFVDALPKTVSGKINRSALPRPRKGSETEAFSQPMDQLEQRLVEFWSEILGLESSTIGRDMNFFRLGGHSLKATVLVSLIRKEWGIEFPLGKVFSFPTVEGIASEIRQADKTVYDDITPVEKRDYYPQSSAQKRLFFLDQLSDIGASYNMPMVFEISGAIDIEFYQKTFQELIHRHEALRSSFFLIGEEPVQRVVNHVEFTLQHLILDRAEQDDQAIRTVMRDFVRPFVLSKPPLLRAAIVEAPDGPSMLLCDMHHIVADGASTGILMDDFTKLFAGERLPSLRLQYRDFAVWQRKLFNGDSIRQQEDFWRRELDGDLPRLELPVDEVRPPVFTFAGDHYGWTMEGEAAEGCRRLCRQTGATMFMLMMAAYNVLLFRYSGQEDIIVGTGIAGRHHSDLQKIIGMFVNSLAMRFYPNGSKDFQSFLEEVKVKSLQAFENQDVQFEDLVEDLNPERDPSRNPLFDVSLVVQNFEFSKKEADDISVTSLGFQNKTSKFDVSLFVYQLDDDAFYFNMEYYTPIFKASTIQRMAIHFSNIIRTVVERPGIALADIDFLPEEERIQLLRQFSGVETAAVCDGTLTDRFSRVVETVPDYIALVNGENAFTYNNVLEQALLTASYLKQLGVGAGSIVGICAADSVIQAAAIWGVLLASGAFVALSPNMPEERLNKIIQDAGLNIVLGEVRHLRLLNRLQWQNESLEIYCCPDSDNIDTEIEEETHLMDRSLWDYIAESASDDIEAGGWISSYTGQPFSPEEMDEYGDNVLRKLEPFLHKEAKVLEIGCASGLSMYRIAPKVALYYGTDISDTTIKRNAEKIEKEGIQNIRLEVLGAHQLRLLEESDFDLIIINSVIQAFPGHNYLRSVIWECACLLKDQGQIFIGDCMDLDLKEKLVKEMEAYKSDHRQLDIKTRIDFSDELFVSRDFFRDLENEYSEVASIECSRKIFSIENELTKFRFDALVLVDKTNASPARTKKTLKRRHDRRAMKESGLISLEAPSHRDPAYLIYTSGSTGVPKGALVEHHSVANSVDVRCRTYGFDNKTVALQLFDFVFDGFITSFFTPLVCGGRLVLPGHSGAHDFDWVVGAIARYCVGHFIAVPSLFRILMEQSEGLGLSCLRTVTLAGDMLKSDLVNLAAGKYNRLELVNEYGVSEAAVLSTMHRSQQNKQEIRIGNPIAGAQIYILDPRQRLQPLGVPGELCIAGAGLSRGYLNDPERTAQTFVPNPFVADQRLYRSGDCARWREDGAIELLGRIDFQIKIRGYRIELGEVETALLSHVDVKDVLVSLCRTDEEERLLVAYLIADGTGAHSKPTVSQLREFMGRRLPDYMIPSHFMFVDQFPLSASGKVDRSKLPKPGGSRPELSTAYIAPENPLGRVVAETWQEVLKLDKVGLHDNFFDLGGNSIDIVKTCRKLEERLDRQIPVVSMFRFPTIQTFIHYLEHGDEPKAFPEEWREEELDHEEDLLHQSIGLLGDE